MPSKTQEAIDHTLETAQGKGFRTHLGASIIARPCARQIWYTFRWAKSVRHKAKLLRLFDRGNLEEARFVSWLRRSGIHVEDVDPATGKQFRIEDHNGHFGGSLDSKLFDTPDFPGIWILGEFKTHNDKSFKELVKLGVKKAKPEHYGQMQVYMEKQQLPYGLYIAINKNDDDIYTEVVYYDEMTALQLIDRAGKIIAANEPPPRISENAGWYVCNFCDFRTVCFEGKPMRPSCRTCEHARPVDNAGWLCTAFNFRLSEELQHTAHQQCGRYTAIRQ